MPDFPAAIADALKITDSATASVEMRIGLSGGAANVLQKLTEELGQDRGEVIARALVLLHLGVVSQKEGNLVSIVDAGGKVLLQLDLLP